MMKTSILLLLIASIFGTGLAQETRVIPFVLDPSAPGLDNSDYVEVAYFLKPNTEPVFEELAEKVWWIQDRSFLILGSTGQPLPLRLVRRAELYLQVYLNGQAIWGQVLLIHPQKQAITITHQSGQVLDQLKASIGKTVSLDSLFLAELANYLAGNLSAIDITATSYAIEGYGEVINTAGEWLGAAMGTGSSVWSQSADKVFLNSELVGIGTNAPQAKLHIVPSLSGQNGIVVDGIAATPAVRVNGGATGYAAIGAGIGASFSDVGTWGVHVEQVGAASTSLSPSTSGGFAIEGAAGFGLFIGHTDKQGIDIGSTLETGIRIGSSGTPSSIFASGNSYDGIEIQGVQGHGLFVGGSNQNGFQINRAGSPAKTGSFYESTGNGVAVREAEHYGLHIGYADYGVGIIEAARYGFSVASAYRGVSVGTVDEVGVHIFSGGTHGVLVENAGAHGVAVANSSQSAYYVENTTESGLEIMDSGQNAIKIHNSGWSAIDIDGTTSGSGISLANTHTEGIYVQNAGEHAIRIFNTQPNKHGLFIDSTNTGSDGVHIENPGGDGVEVTGADTTYAAGVKTRDSYYGLRSYNNDYGIYVTACPTAGYFQGTGGGLTNPALRADATNSTNGIAAHFSNDANDSTMVLENDSTAANSHFIKAFQEGAIKFRVATTGWAYGNGFSSSGADVAESFDVYDDKSIYEPGDVMVISTQEDRQLDRSKKAYSTKIAGVYATQPGVLLGPDVKKGNRIPLGVVGVIPTKVNLEGGPISRGDLLVTSSEPGVAMKADASLIRHGSIIGKALENYDHEELGKIEVLVNVK